MKRVVMILFILGMGKIAFTQTNAFPSSGDVGIGTTNPNIVGTVSVDRGLDINAPNNGNITSLNLSTGTTRRVSLFADYSTAELKTNGSVPLTLGVNGNDSFRITTAGNLGIGTTNPNIVGTVSVDRGLDINAPNNGNITSLNLSTGTTRRISLFADNSTAELKTNGSIPLTLGVNGNDNFRITTAGNVGIGTMSPDSKLTVAGKIHSQEVKVTTTGGADFVFEEDYKLRSLSETENFIKKNKHLPEIASADEMKNIGIQLGEMSIKLLQKIEELTLHLIEKDKQVSDLQQRVKKLENK